VIKRMIIDAFLLQGCGCLYGKTCFSWRRNWHSFKTVEFCRLPIKKRCVFFMWFHFRWLFVLQIDLLPVLRVCLSSKLNGNKKSGMSANKISFHIKQI